MNLAEKRRLEREARIKNLKLSREGTEWKPKLPYMQQNEIAACVSLMTNAEVFEYGSGGSTIFYGARANTYYSLETDPTYYEVVKASLTTALDHVKICLESVDWLQWRSRANPATVPDHCLSISLSLCLSFSLFLSHSLDVYIYIYIHVFVVAILDDFELILTPCWALLKCY